MLSTSLTPEEEEQLHNPFQDEASIALIEPDIDLTGQSTTKPAEPPKIAVNGNIGSNDHSSSYTPTDTLDEPVSVTIVKFQKYILKNSPPKQMFLNVYRCVI